MPLLTHTRRALLFSPVGGAEAIIAPTFLGPPAVAGSSQLDLSWVDNARNEGGYKIHRSLSAVGPWAQIAVTAPNATSYSDTGLTAETTYYYTIQAFKGGVNGAYSAVVSGTTGAAEFSVSYQTNLQQEMYSDQYVWKDSALTQAATADADVVGGWQSRAGTKHLINAGADSVKPILKLNQINSFPSVRFDGSNDSLKALFTLARPWHVFMVMRQITWTSGDVVLCGGTTNVMAMLQFGTTPELVGYNGNTIGGWNNNAAVGAWKVVEFLGTAAASRIRVNNTTATAPDPASASALGGVALGSNNSGGENANIEFAAFLLYDAELNSTNRDTVVNALATRYGISL